MSQVATHNAVGKRIVELARRMRCGLSHVDVHGTAQPDGFWWTWEAKFGGLPFTHVKFMSNDNRVYYFSYTLADGRQSEGSYLVAIGQPTKEKQAVEMPNAIMNVMNLDKVLRAVTLAIVKSMLLFQQTAAN